MRSELGEVPLKLRELFASKMLFEQEFDYLEEDAMWVAQFEPLDEEAFALRWPDIDDGCVVFALNGIGDQFAVRAGGGLHWPVFIYHHDGADPELVADSIEHFLAGLRQPG